jgi:multimeric flavodoxin WrbA
MKHLLVVYHSQSGSAEKLAQSAVVGAKLEDVEVRLCRAMAAGLTDLTWCDAVLFVTPENFGALAGGMKDFFDRTYYPALSLQLNRAYAVIVSAGNDGRGAAKQLERIALGYPLRKVAETLIVRGGASTEARQNAHDLGHALAAGLSMGIY